MKPLQIAACSAVVAVFAMTMSAASLVFAQNNDSEPWWPHPIWGADDRAGASNWNTPEKVREAISLVTTGNIYELGHVYDRTMPLQDILGRSYEIFIPYRSTGAAGDNGLVFNDEFIATQLGQIGTQFDGPGHVGKRMNNGPGSWEDVFYNGVTSTEMQSPYGLLQLGVENVKPYITRGILIDVAGSKGMEMLPEGYTVSLEDIRAALEMQGMSEDDIRPGDAILFNYGWWRIWSDASLFDQKWPRRPGIGREVALWVVDRKASMVGSDIATDDPSAEVHHELTLKNGIFNLENMNFESVLADEVYEFLFVFTPLRLKGATGSPARPLAIR